MDESGSGFRTQDGPPSSYTTYNNTNGITNGVNSGDYSNGVRGICEDLAWLLLYEISTALKYMHDRGKLCLLCCYVALYDMAMIYRYILLQDLLNLQRIFD